MQAQRQAPLRGAHGWTVRRSTRLLGAAALLLSVACALSAVYAQNTTVVVAPPPTPASLFATLFTGYDNQIRPGIAVTSQPLVINTALRINLLYNIDSKEETFQLDLFVNEYWTDPRLAFDKTKYGFTNMLRVPSKYSPWLPDTFFFNAIKCQALADSSLTLQASGEVFWSRHQSCTFHSPFGLQAFPFDSQILTVKRTSFSYTDTELLLNFLTSSGWRPDPVQDFSNSLFKFDYAYSDESSLQFINTHTANAYLAVTRRSDSYILKMIAPMFFLTLLSTGSYAVDCASPPARVSFSVSLILSIITFNSVVSADLPKINYATKIDWYIWYCFLFVVGALAEFAIVNNLLVSKRLGPDMPYYIDDLALWTMPYTWLVINLWYWPIYDSPAVHIILAMVWSGWMLLNVYRVFYWNAKHGQRGMWAAMKAFWKYSKHEWWKYRHPDEYEAEQAAIIRAEEAKSAELDATIAHAEATGGNAFEAPIGGIATGSAADIASPLATSHIATFDRPPSPSLLQHQQHDELTASASPGFGDEPNPFDDQPLLHHRNPTAMQDEEYDRAYEPVDAQPNEDGQDAENLNLV